MDWRLEITRPTILALLAVLPLLYWGYRRSLTDFTRRRKLTSLLTRVVIVVLLVLTLCGLNLLKPTQETMTVFLVDESRSIDEDAAAVAHNFLLQAQEEAGSERIGIMRFASEPSGIDTTFEIDPLQENGTPVTEEEDNDSAAGAETEDGSETPLLESTPPPASREEKLEWRNGTNLEDAMELAVASIPPHYVPRLVLISDGNETLGDAFSSALRNGIPISTIPLPASERPEVQLTDLALPSQVRQGEPFYVEVIVQSTRETEATIRLFRGAFKILDEVQALEAGENRFRFPQTIDSERQVEYTARVESTDDSILDNNNSSGIVFTGGKPRILLIENESQECRDLTWALREQEVVVDVRPPEGTPRTLSDLENYELIILANVPATSLSMRQMDVIRTYVRDLGGGMLMLGGENSFGLGGYYKTAVEEILPVRSDFEKEKENPSLAIVLVIDKSGSMSGEKIEMAKDAARAAVELLSVRDQVGVIAFDGSSYVVCPVQGAAAGMSIDGSIASIAAGGGTSIYPAMCDAYDQLTTAQAKLKHVILLTDGHSEPGDFEGIAQRMADSRITVSTVGVGGGADHNLLAAIAKTGQGRCYSCDDPQAIPQIFAKETMTASKSAIHEIPFLPQLITPTEALAGLEIEAAPPLLGFVVTRPKPTSQFILATESGEPLLVWWRYGLGMSGAFTSDAKSRWAAEWVAWPEFAPFWSQVVRHMMRKSDVRGTNVEIQRFGDHTQVILDAADETGTYLSGAEGRLTVIGPDLSQEEILLEQVAAGRYTATIPTDQRGDYHIQLGLDSGSRTILNQSRGLTVGYPDELRLRPTNTELLTRIAETTGGRFNPVVSELFEPDDRKARRAVALWPWLLTIAAILFVMDVALRRVDRIPFLPSGKSG
jgi:Ca-activated chloride channel homolog